jgi:hypothetical protein
VHDLAVNNITAWPNLTLPSHVHVNVTVENRGTSKETFNVTVHADNLTVETATVTDLAPESNRTLKLNCNLFPLRSMIFPPLPWSNPWQPVIVNVTILAEATVPAGEGNISNNVLADGTISLIWLCIDLNGDGKINILDLAIEAKALFNYGPHPLEDHNGDGVVGILDFAIVARYFGRVYFELSNSNDP